MNVDGRSFLIGLLCPLAVLGVVFGALCVVGLVRALRARRS